MFDRFGPVAAIAMALCAAVFHADTVAQIHRVDEMAAPEIEALPRERTAIILVGGILEEHGPHLPSGSDTFMNEWWARQLAEAIVARPGWHALLFPTVPLATSPANVLGDRHIFAGSYPVRPATERAIFLDLASRLGEQKFRWVFVMHNHGSPLHNLMVDQAGDYFHDLYGGTMVNLPGLLYEPEPDPRPAQVVAEEGRFEVHAGMSETSRILFLRPDLVHASINSAAPLTADSPAQAVAIARSAGWAGYLGSPRLATSAYGAHQMRVRSDQYVRTALALLDGGDPAALPRISAVAFGNKDIAAVEASTLQHEKALEQQQNDWMARKGIR